MCGSKVAKARLQQHADGCLKEHTLQADAPGDQSPGDQSPAAKPSLQPCIPPCKPGCLTPKNTSSQQPQPDSANIYIPGLESDPAGRAASRGDAPKPVSRAAGKETSQHAPGNAFAVMLTAQRQLSQVTALESDAVAFYT